MERLHGIINHHTNSYYNDEHQLFFDPLLYIQRYQAAIACITHKRFKKSMKRIVEFGCSEMKFFVYLKNGMTDRDLKIWLVDIDAALLQNHMAVVQPLLAEHIRRREHKLEVEVWKGNVALPNCNFTSVDCVVALELIEHLYPTVLEEIPFHIFSLIAPKIAIFSTPNYEFNQLFNLEEGRIFRHDDHKFEWTRQRFQDWCDNICQRFPNYTVQIEGVGTPPKKEQLDTIGCCSQLAIFLRKDFIESIDQMEQEESDVTGNTLEYDDSEDPDLIPCDEYELLKSIKYPVHEDTRDRRQKILDESAYHINRLRFIDDFYNSDNYRIEIPVHIVVNACWEVADDKNEILEAIKENHRVENELIIFEDDYDEYDENCEKVGGENVEGQ